MTCPKVDAGRHNLRCPNSEQQSYLNSNNTTFPTYTWSSDAAARLGIPFREKDWYGIPFREKVWYGIPFRNKTFVTPCKDSKVQIRPDWIHLAPQMIVL